MNLDVKAAGRGLGPVRQGKTTSWPLVVLLGLLSCLFTWVVVGGMGIEIFVLALLALIGFSVLLLVWVREETSVLLYWFFMMSGFRYAALMRMPGLPDFSLLRLLFMWVLFALLLRFIVKGVRPRGPFAADLVLFLHTAYMLIQLTYFESDQFNLWLINNVGCLTGFLFAKNFYSNGRQLRLLFWFFGLIMIYYSITSIAEHWNLRFLVWPKYILNADMGKTWYGRSRGPFLQPGVFGTVMGMYTLPVFFLLMKARGVGKTIAMWLLLVVSLLGVFYSYTRGCWVATFLGILTLAVLRPRFRRGLALAGFVALIGGGLGMMQAAGDEYLADRFENVDTIENRLGAMASLAKIIRDNPVFGIGFFKYNEYREMYNMGSYIPFYGYVKRSASYRVPIHDIYWGRMAEEGAVSVLLLFLFMVVVGRMFLRKWKADPQEEWFNRDVLAVFAGVTTTYLAGGLFIDYRYFDLINIVPFVLAGIIMGYRNERYA